MAAKSSEEESWQMMDRFVGAGGNFIDTADVYSLGISEEIVGRWMKDKQRDSLVIATKVRFAMGEGQNEVGLSRKHILSGVEASLRRLQNRVYRPVPGAYVGRWYPPGRNAQHAGYPGAERQGALHRGKQLQRAGSCKKPWIPANSTAGKPSPACSRCTTCSTAT